MQVIVNTGPNELKMVEVPTPQPQAGRVLIQTGACAICASDLEMIAGWPRTKFPSVPGHEWAGTVAAVGPDVDPSLVGSRCVAENVLSDGGEVGFEHPGGYGEFLITEASKVHVLPADFPMVQAALIEPLAVAVHAVRRLRLEDKSRALVFGDGVIGLFTTALLSRAGVEEVYVVGSRSFRLAFAQGLGAMNAVSYRDANGDYAAALRLHPDPFPNIVEASGASRAMEAAFQAVAHGGHILVLGDQGERLANFPWSSLMHQEIELIGSNASAGAWPEAVQLATSGELPLEPFVTHRFPADQFEEAIALAGNRRADTVRVVMEW